MKNYVVGICSMFENEVKLFKISAENEYEAIKIGMLELVSDDEESKQYELDWQNSENYPQDLDDLSYAYQEIAFSVIEI